MKVFQIYIFLLSFATLQAQSFTASSITENSTDVLTIYKGRLQVNVEETQITITKDHNDPLEFYRLRGQNVERGDVEIFRIIKVITSRKEVDGGVVFKFDDGTTGRLLNQTLYLESEKFKTFIR